MHTLDQLQAYRLTLLFELLLVRSTRAEVACGVFEECVAVEGRVVDFIPPPPPPPPLPLCPVGVHARLTPVIPGRLIQ